MVSAQGRGKSTRFDTQPSKACAQIVGVAQTSWQPQHTQLKI